MNQTNKSLQDILDGMDSLPTDEFTPEEKAGETLEYVPSLSVRVDGKGDAYYSITKGVRNREGKIEYKEVAKSDKQVYITFIQAMNTRTCYAGSKNRVCSCVVDSQGITGLSMNPRFADAVIPVNPKECRFYAGGWRSVELTIESPAFFKAKCSPRQRWFCLLTGNKELSKYKVVSFDVGISVAKTIKKALEPFVEDGKPICSVTGMFKPSTYDVAGRKCGGITLVEVLDSETEEIKKMIKKTEGDLRAAVKDAVYGPINTHVTLTEKIVGKRTRDALAIIEGGVSVESIDEISKRETQSKEMEVAPDEKELLE